MEQQKQQEEQQDERQEEQQEEPRTWIPLVHRLFSLHKSESSSEERITVRGSVYCAGIGHRRVSG